MPALRSLEIQTIGFTVQTHVIAQMLRGKTGFMATLAQCVIESPSPLFSTSDTLQTTTAHSVT